MRRRPAPAPATPPSNKKQSTGSCAPARGRGPEPAQDRCAAPHGRLRAQPGPAPAADRPAAAAPHDTSPANNNRPEERRTSCRQQPAPPPRDAAKMSPLNILLWYVPSSRYIWSSAPILFLQEQIIDIIITARHASQPRSSTSHPPQQKDAVHRELRPGKGKGASAGAGSLRRATRPAADLARAPPPTLPDPPPQPHTTRPPQTTTGRRK